MGRNGQKVRADDVVPVAEARSSLFLLASSVELPDVLTFVFSWQGYQLCIRTKYRGTEQVQWHAPKAKRKPKKSSKGVRRRLCASKLH